MNKKSIGAFLLSAALLMGGTATTFAYFTNSANTNTQSITLGNVQVAFTPVNGTKNWDVSRGYANVVEAMKIDPCDVLSGLWGPGGDYKDNGYDEIAYGTDYNSISNVAPGDLLCKSFTLKNTGSLDAKVALSLEQLKVNGVAVTNPVDTTIPHQNIHFKAYALNVDGTPGNEVQLVVGTLPGQYILDANKGETIKVYAEVYLDATMNNGGMNKNITFDVKADATQWNNPQWTEAGGPLQ